MGIQTPPEREPLNLGEWGIETLEKPVRSLLSSGEFQVQNSPELLNS
jgi:hypothetical protein